MVKLPYIPLLLPAHPAAAQRPVTAQAYSRQPTMRLLLTGANSPLARALIATQLSIALDTRRRRALRRAARRRAPIDSRSARSRPVAAEIVADVDAILHLAPLYTRLDTEQETLDYATRGTYQLVLAAAEANVSRLIVGSTLDLFAPLWSRYRVDESWRPRPQPQLDQLCAYLAELATREVIRVTDTPTLCLRLGKVVGDEQAASDAAV